jgi:hypothetical protein
MPDTRSDPYQVETALDGGAQTKAIFDMSGPRSRLCPVRKLECAQQRRLDKHANRPACSEAAAMTQKAKRAFEPWRRSID